jgi:sec-independent protein translocase protein TatB
VFGSLGWAEIIMLLVVALLVFGPDKLPSVARDAARLLKQLRGMAQGARTQLKSELGPEFADFDLDSLNPRSFVRKHLLDGDDDLDEKGRTSGQGDLRASPQAPLRDGERAPYDPDAT